METPNNINELTTWAYKKAPEVNKDDLTYVLAERLGLTPSQFLLEKDRVVTENEFNQIKKDIKKLNRGDSPQYVLGYAWFLGYKIQVKKGVLIPRFETEELVNWALDHLKAGMKVLDLGTGSGAISVALLKEASKKNIKDITLYASDITDEALRTSEENFLNYNLDVIVRKINVLTGLEKFDIIISNPPYIKTSEKDLMDKNVLANEPKEALFGGKDGIEFYQKFVKQVRYHLNSHGQFFLEFGFSEKQQLAELFAKELPDFDIEFRNDLAGKPRMVYGKWQK